MRQTFILLAATLLVELLIPVGLTQQDRLQGRWEGTAKSVQGERPATLIFKREADAYSGTITGLQGPIPFKEIKVDGDNRISDLQTSALFFWFRADGRSRIG